VTIPNWLEDDGPSATVTPLFPTLAPSTPSPVASPAVVEPGLADPASPFEPTVVTLPDVPAGPSGLDLERLRSLSDPTTRFGQRSTSAPTSTVPTSTVPTSAAPTSTTVDTQFGTVTVPTTVSGEQLSSSAVPAISAHGLSRTVPGPQGPVQILSDVSFDLAPGDLFIIDGPSGSGTSTLIHCLAGLDVIDDGRISINGEDMSRWSDNDRSRFRAAATGVIPQDLELVDDFSARDNTSLPLLAAGWTTTAAASESERVLTMLGLADRMEHLPGQLSRGERQRVAVARAIAGDPLVLWADHPTETLDPEAGQLVVDALLDHHRRGATVIVASRDRRFALPGARFAHLDRGRLVLVDPAASSQG
jgi:predicted ABC-type transport system involved in lysophospholipase L1 biosynthesis ATPase subunit